MNYFDSLAALAVLAVTAAPVIADTMVPVDWSQLPDPSAQKFEDPYRDLAPEQMENLMALVRLSEALKVDGRTDGDRRQLETRMAELKGRLQAVGVDDEWLLSQRWAVAERRMQAAVAVNGKLDGQLVEIAGYLIPGPPIDSGEASAYLLPNRDVCNHLPPPAPNQLVRLLIKDVPEAGFSCVPATVQGTLRAKDERHEVIVIDHSLPMWSAWTLETEALRTVGSSAANGTTQQ